MIRKTFDKVLCLYWITLLSGNLLWTNAGHSIEQWFLIFLEAIKIVWLPLHSPKQS